MLQKCQRGAASALWLYLATCALLKPCRPIPSYRKTAARLYHAGVSCNNEQQVIAPLRKHLKDELKARRVGAGSTPRGPLSDLQLRLEDWELTVGIEIHAQLNTSRKLFSGKPQRECHG
jgi:aspartyl-tRNA(Asn)/glutamyl-tRNA(Gln) amidotransferase subunit B